MWNFIRLPFLYRIDFHVVKICWRNDENCIIQSYSQTFNTEGNWNKKTFLHVVILQHAWVGNPMLLTNFPLQWVTRRWKNISCLEPHYKGKINAFFVGALLQLLNNPERVCGWVEKMGWHTNMMPKPILKLIQTNES